MKKQFASLLTVMTLAGLVYHELSISPAIDDQCYAVVSFTDSRFDPVLYEEQRKFIEFIVDSKIAGMPIGFPIGQNELTFLRGDCRFLRSTVLARKPWRATWKEMDRQSFSQAYEKIQGRPLKEEP